MRASVGIGTGTLLVAALLAGINGADIEVRLFDEGHFVEIFVVTLANTSSQCFLITPSNAKIDLLSSESLSDKYEYLPPNFLSTCRVKINDLDKNDQGSYSLHAVVKSEEDDTENELKEQVHLVIRGGDASEETISSEETVTSEENSKLSAEDVATPEESSEEDNNASSESSVAVSHESLESSSSEEKVADDTAWLSELQFVTRPGLNVDINLPRIQNPEKCTLTKPDGTTVYIEETTAGVTAHSSSDFVSCRVVVGPMDASLLGKWTLCGYYEENNVKHTRCQIAEIVWRSSSNPDSMWHTTINAKFDHVVHFGGTLTPAVRGSGTVVSCHLVTPDNEDLFVTRDREYPNVRLAQNTDSACSIAIGPIVEAHLGDWAIYGTFNSALSGYNEVRLPINMELYDKENPYDQAYNVTTLNPTQHVINLGSTIPVEVTGTGAVDVCQFTMPSGETYLSTGSLPTGVSFDNVNRVACRLSVGPINEDMLGDWLLIGKFRNRDIHTENRLTFTIIQEDPRNPIEEDRTVQNLDEQFIDTSIGASHRVTIASDIFGSFQSCHIRTPEGLQYTIMEGFHIPGIEVVTGSNIFCGVNIEVSEDLIGTWTLISREIRSSQPTERRLPFVIYVEESVEAVPNEITITEGNSIHVRLANPTELHETCKLRDPNDEEAALANADDNHRATCGFVVPSVHTGHNGTWNIVYGKKIIYKAPILVNVNAREDPVTFYVNWIEHTSINQIVGPEDAVYCRLLTHGGDVMFDGFGRCHVDINRVMQDQHGGEWSMVVGMPGRIVTEQHFLMVIVTEAASKPVVTSHVANNEETVELTCSVTSAQQKTGCLFRSPSGAVLVANQGVSERRYVFHVNQTSTEYNSYYSCSLQITEPATTDLGLWRCDLESEEEHYYGFLAVLCPWDCKDLYPSETVVASPVLETQADLVSVDEHEPVTLACSARAPLRYCYFRAPNGTVFNVGPGMSFAAMEYVGAGLDAGECGVRFQNVRHSDSGQWSCHAGIEHQEQSRDIFVSVEEEMSVWSYIQSNRLMIQGNISWNRRLEYCRFVRFDGFGFTSDTIPSPHYLDEGDLSRGFCKISTRITPEDLQPWTVVAKLEGRDGEISRVLFVNLPGPPTPGYYNALLMWLPLLLIVTGSLMLGAALAPPKNRRWAAERASGLRESMRASVRYGMQRFTSFRKKEIADTNPAA